MPFLVGLQTEVSRVLDKIPFVADLEAAVFRVLERFRGRPKEALSALVGLYIAYQVGKVVYRLKRHPLARFPGPLLGRASFKYEMFYDLFRDGQMEYKLDEDLHPEYGSIVRYAPNRLRIKSPEAWFELYKQSTPLHKDGRFYFDMSDVASMLTVSDNAEHRKRRAAFNASFSKQKMLKAEPLVNSKLKTMTDKMYQLVGGAEINGEECFVNMHYAMMSSAMDTFAQFTFAQDMGALTDPKFEHPMVVGMKKYQDNVAWNKHTRPITITPQEYLPIWLSKIIYPAASATKEFPAAVKAMARMHVEKYKRKEISHNPEDFTVLNSLLEDTDPETLTEDFYDDMFLIFGASFSTSAMTVAHTLYYLSVNESFQTELYEELRSALPNSDAPLQYNELEQLPYLTAVVKEGLRTANAVMGALPRLVPKGGFDLLGTHIPAGTFVEHSIYGMHFNADIFPDPHTFDPSRWLGESGKQLNKYLVPFGGGSRICLGMHMGWIQVFMSIAAVMRKFKLKPAGELKEKGLVLADRWVAANRTEMKFVVTRRET